MTNELARPFLPTRDFEQSKQFYEALGFEKTLDSEVAIFNAGSGGFILQRDEPWGLREVHVIDPAGVLRHIAERRPNAAQDRP